MICADIMQNEAVTLTPDVTVGAAIALLKDHHLTSAVVVDAQNVVMGVFSLRHLLENSLPISMVSESGMGGVVLNAAPGLELRLQKTLQQTTAAVMDRRFFSVNPDTPATRAAQWISEKGGLVVVLDQNNGQLKGVLDENIMLDGLLIGAADRMKKVVS